MLVRSGLVSDRLGRAGMVDPREWQCGTVCAVALCHLLTA